MPDIDKSHKDHAPTLIYKKVRSDTDPGLKAIYKKLHERKLEGKTLSSQAELSEILSLSKQAVSKWTQVPSHRVPHVSKALGIPRHVLRGDLYEAPKRAKKTRK